MKMVFFQSAVLGAILKVLVHSLNMNKNGIFHSLTFVGQCNDVRVMVSLQSYGPHSLSQTVIQVICKILKKNEFYSFLNKKLSKLDKLHKFEKF